MPADVPVGSRIENFPDEQIARYGNSLTVVTDVQDVEGYKFVGWSTSKYSQEVIYNKGEIVTYNGNEDLELYAVWKKEKYDCS